jgi:hypothetical protein
MRSHANRRGFFASGYIWAGAEGHR